MKCTISTVDYDTYERIVKLYPNLEEKIQEERLRTIASLRWENDEIKKNGDKDFLVPAYYYSECATIEINELREIKELMEIIGYQIIVDEPREVGTELRLIIYDGYME